MRHALTVGVAALVLLAPAACGSPEKPAAPGPLVWSTQGTRPLDAGGPLHLPTTVVPPTLSFPGGTPTIDLPSCTIAVSYPADTLGFAYDSSDIGSDGRTNLTVLNGHLGLATSARVDGYASSEGRQTPEQARHNQVLSQQRADAVRRFITAARSALPVEAQGHGTAHPIASNDNEAGRAANRRVVVTATYPPASCEDGQLRLAAP